VTGVQTCALPIYGGRPSKYKPEFADIAKKLCGKCAFTDAQLADWFEVSVRTINEWKLKHPEFAEALKVGKAETNDLVERGTVAGIIGYYVTVDEMDRSGNVKQLRKWVPGNAHAGMKWLAARRPQVYREQKDVHHTMNANDAFLRFLDQMDEEQKLLKAQAARMIEHQPSPDMKSPAEIEDAILVQYDSGKDPAAR